MAFLIDSDILLRRARKTDAKYPLVTSALDNLRDDGEVMNIVPQNVVEVAAVFTRPVAANGLGLSSADAEHELQVIEALFPVLPDTPEVYRHWRRLFVSPGALGRQVYDMRLVAAMYAHGLTHLLTINVDDFKRYSGIIVVHPKDV